MLTFASRATLAPVLACALAAAVALHPPHPVDALARPAHGNAPVIARVLIVGTVRDEGGAPIPTASVRATARGGGAVLASTVTDTAGAYRLVITGAPTPNSVMLTVRRIGYAVQTRAVAISGATVHADATLQGRAVEFLEDRVFTSAAPVRSERRARRTGTVGEYVPSAQNIPTPPSYVATAPALVRPGAFLPRRAKAGYNREQYDRIDENPFISVAATPRSTFSLDPDRASYANVRRMLREGERPPADAVRLEELINYFPYHAPDPEPGEALGITTEVARAPWRPDHQLVRVTLQARHPDPAALPPSNLVFLIDVSGSMFEPDKLPLVKRALGVLVARLRPIDRVALVAYAGNAGLVLPSTSGEDKARILTAIDHLEAGGSTAGGEGLELAYRVARENARPGANSRVILATDGDFNVGPSSDAEMERLVESKRAEGTYLTVLGFGEGNLQDAKMKKLAKRGNGNYAYVDDIAEAEKVFGQELGGTLVTVANDAKVQVEFNPAVVRTYRLIGYEGRLLRDEDFADDQQDAGDVGAGHTVTAFYEIVPASAPPSDTARSVAPLRYGVAPAASLTRPSRGELLYVQLRYKRPGESTSRLITQITYAPSANAAREPSTDFRFASAVAEFGMLLRDSAYRGDASAAQVLGLARGAIGDDPGGHRAEFMRLVERWQALNANVLARRPD